MFGSDGIPDRVVEKILTFSKYRTVLTLRQVNQQFRNFIDDSKNSDVISDSHLSGIDLTARENCIDLSFYSDEGSSSIQYKREENENANFIERTMIDLGQMLKLQKSTMNYFTLNMNLNPENQEVNPIAKTLPERLTNLLESGTPRLIRTRQLSLLVFTEDQLMAILPFVDSNELRRIYIAFDAQRSVNFGMSEIVKTEQWKSAKELYMRPQEFSADLENLAHFSRSRVCFQRLTSEDLDFLRKMFSNSSNFLEFDGYSKEFDSFENLETLWGMAAQQWNEYSFWYFTFSGSEDVMKIKFCRLETLSCFNILRIDSDDVPSSVVVKE